MTQTKFNSIKGVSVLSIGPALGHGIMIDREGLSQCLAACKARGSVKLIAKHDGEFEDIVGAVTNFRMDGEQVRGDIELFDHPMAPRIREIADKLPDQFGLSIESSGEHAGNPSGQQFFRCTDIDAVALVPRPAANPNGLFGAIRKTNLAEATASTVRYLRAENRPAATTFAAMVERQGRAGAKHPFVAAIREDGGKAYKAYLLSFSQPKPTDKKTTTQVESELRTLMSAGAKDRGQAIIQLSRKNPKLYNAARSAGIL